MIKALPNNTVIVSLSGLMNRKITEVCLAAITKKPKSQCYPFYALDNAWIRPPLLLTTSRAAINQYLLPLDP